MGKNMSLNHYLFLYELRDLHRAEERFPDGLWHAMQSVTSVECKDALSKLMDQTLVHAVRLDQVFKLIRVTPVASPCPIMDTLIIKAEQQKATDSHLQNQLMVQVVEEMINYLVGAYVTTHAYASLLPQNTVEHILESSLREKEASSKQFHQLALKSKIQPWKTKAATERPHFTPYQKVQPTRMKRGLEAPLSLT